MTYQPPRIFVKPTPLEQDGQPTPRVVRKLTGAVLAAEGEWVNRDSYWLRRLSDGEVEQITDAPPEESEPAPAAAPVTEAAPAAAAAPTEKPARADKK
ncbi:DUF2635 domain-containing protein [Pseudacidovorax intermedius]|uniref:DUF2635 domain-containing protein n=1 Tax=Pseudacidovorax intermedius TaxID=433924 RepID=UPI0026F1FF1A|nr:DUF2635 domain-containing protein [Pseudacidovorax intermedius]